MPPDKTFSDVLYHVKVCRPLIQITLQFSVATIFATNALIGKSQYSKIVPTPS